MKPAAGCHLDPASPPLLVPSIAWAAVWLVAGTLAAWRWLTH